MHDEDQEPDHGITTRRDRSGEVGTSFARRGSRIIVMSIDRNELHELLDALPDDQLPFAAADLRRRATAHSTDRSGPAFAWIGMIDDGPVDASSPERIEQELARGFGRR